MDANVSQSLMLHLGGGALAGVAVGYAFKKLSRLALFALGIGIILLYLLMQAGMISVHWNAVSQGLNDGSHALGQWLEAMVKELSASLVGFGGGFLIGLKL